VEVAEANPANGYRMVTALVRRKLGRAVNRTQVVRVKPVPLRVRNRRRVRQGWRDDLVLTPLSTRATRRAPISGWWGQVLGTL